MRRQRSVQIDDSGHDSFLDIVANLVGILVILIMVVGVRARHAWEAQEATPAAQPTATVTQELAMETPAALPVVQEAQAEEESAEVARLETEIQSLERQTANLQRDAFELDGKAAQLGQQTEMKAAERDQLQLLLATIENEIDVRRSKLAEQQQSAFDTNQKIAQVTFELEDTRSKLATLSLDFDAPVELTHHPTPIAKTVFDHEEHLRLSRGRVVRIPMDELVEAQGQDALNKRWKLKDAKEFTESLPPIGGFRLKYTIKRVERIVDTPNGPARVSGQVLDRFSLLPIADDLGEPIKAALAGDSALDQLLSQSPPDSTTFTVWTYTDSFTEFRELQEHLIQRGYQVAARPLPKGYPISGSPAGNRSAAQ